MPNKISTSQCGISFSLEEQLAKSDEIANTLATFLPSNAMGIVRAWRMIFQSKARKYGTKAWSVNGFRGLYCSISAKHHRVIFGRQDEFDAYRDVFGYTILGLFLLYKHGLSDERLQQICQRYVIDGGSVQVRFENVVQTLWKNEESSIGDIAEALVSYCFVMAALFSRLIVFSIALVIPTHQRPEMVLSAIQSVPPEYNIYVVYNEGREEDVALLKNVSNVTLVTTQGRGAGVMSDGVARALTDNEQCKFLIFMNDDCELHEGAVEALIEPFFFDEEIGVVGVLNGWKNFYDLEKTPILFERPYTGVTWATPVAYYNKVGGLDIQQNVAEDLDYQLRLRVLGKKIMVSQNADATHHWDSPGGLEESGIWRGKERHFIGRVIACRKITAKMPGILYLDKNMQWVISQDALQMYRDLYKDLRIDLTTDGIVWLYD